MISPEKERDVTNEIDFANISPERMTLRSQTMMVIPSEPTFAKSKSAYKKRIESDDEI